MGGVWGVLRGTRGDGGVLRRNGGDLGRGRVGNKRVMGVLEGKWGGVGGVVMGIMGGIWRL